MLILKVLIMAMVKKCQHCKRKKVNRPRGLCWSCYYTPLVRDLHPSTSKYLGKNDDGRRPRFRLPEEPTDARPGSEEKIRIMAARYERGEAIFHPDDADARPGSGE